jgi:hypothetical protein
LMLSTNNYYAYFQVNAGYQNAIADFYLKEGDLKAAETFYKSSTQYDLYNNKANSTLASMALSQNDKKNAAFFFKQSVFKSPNPFSFTGLSLSLEAEDMYYDAIFSLQEGLRKFKNEPHLLTNLAALQAKSNLKDSVLINLDMASKKCKKCEVENTNFLAFWIENAKPSKLNEMTALVPIQSSNSFKANQVAILRMLGENANYKGISMSKDSVLDVSTAAYMFNSLSNPNTVYEKEFSADMLRKLQQIQGNEPYYEELSWAYSQAQYYSFNKPEGLKQLSLLAGSKTKLKKIYAQNLGLLLLKEGVINGAKENLLIAGDTISANALSSDEVRETIDFGLSEKAKLLLGSNLSIANYKEVVKKSPLNPYLLKEVADFLSKNNKDLDAYNLIFDATELNPKATLLWKTYIEKALNLTQLEYAKEGLMKLKEIGSEAEIFKYTELIQSKEQELGQSKFE